MVMMMLVVLFMFLMLLVFFMVTVIMMVGTVRPVPVMMVIVGVISPVHSPIGTRGCTRGDACRSKGDNKREKPNDISLSHSGTFYLLNVPP